MLLRDKDYELAVTLGIIDEDTKKLDKCTPGIDKRCNSYYASLGI